MQYFVNTQSQSNGDHEVHVQYCVWMPNSSNAKPLGMFENCYEAVREAAKTFRQVNGCIHCCRPCHTQ
jgi:hypothetical protein